MKVDVKLFAAARQIAGSESIVVRLDDAATVRSLRAAMAEEYPELARVLHHSAFAINSEYSRDDTPIPENASIACIPPVSGG